MTDELTLTEIRKLAVAIGMTRLSDEQLEQLARAARSAQARRAALPLDTLAPADEPAHVYVPPFSLRESGRG